ncbi:acetylxylan esterase [Saliphagus sp. LR7]|uniref:glucuronyl esterase domain-containing protein n=1 Tax=Saliphagus sp. LR7 TaxID=2282654 RepID=UPI000DF7ED3C|nr:acetylxylan esterase [Saliphagus sp. LR7]
MDRPFDPADLPAPRDLPRQSLPDPLKMFDGTPIETPGDWNERRRPELKQLFEHYVYGYRPPAPEIETTVERTEEVLDGQAILTEIDIVFTEVPAAPSPRLALFTPSDVDAPVPTVLALNSSGNHTTVGDDRVTLTETTRQRGGTPDERGNRADSWCVPYLLSRGYGFATAHCEAFSTDEDRTGGVHPHIETPGIPEGRWGTLAAWAWGLERCVTVLESEEHVDGTGICLSGHSRRGKAALLAAAFDERAAIAIPQKSGTGGTALSRGNDQETISRINQSFPHWFNGRFPAFSGRTERLPVDQHLLIALVAPRPVIDLEGMRDHWANFGRARDAIRAAAPAYDLLEGAPFAEDGGEASDGRVEDDVPRGDLLLENDRIGAETCGRLLQYRRDTGHTMERGYWRAALDFADCHLRE